MAGALLVNDQILCNTPSDKQQEIISVINQASKSWMIPTDIEITHHGIGVPSIAVVSGAYYLDVVTGNVYLGGTEWVLDRTLASAQDALNTPSLWQPNYSTRTVLYKHTEDISEQYFTVENDGYIQLNVRTLSTAGTPFYRLYVNGTVVCEAYGKDNAVYDYIWTPTVFVKSGDRVGYSMTTHVTDGQMASYVYFIEPFSL